jgi:lipopolysaccharide biosynthesis protein
MNQRSVSPREFARLAADTLRREYARIAAEVRSHPPAMRYRRTGDALQFIRETHLELPTQPPPGSHSLVLFAHFDPQGVVDPYVVHYLEALKRVGATIVFVSGSPHLTPESVEPIRGLCAGIYTRDTLSLDFGSWHLAWKILEQRGWSLDQFDRFALANDSVYGPLFPIEEMWNSFEGADMYGAVESFEFATHLQSFFLVWDLNARTRRFLDGFWSDFQYIASKTRLIRRYEIGLSKRARKAGLSMKAFASVAAIQGTYELSASHQWSKKFSGAPFNSTLYYWDGLIEHLRFPFLKTVLPRRNEPWHDSMKDLREFIEQNTAYPYELIGSNLNRLGIRPLDGSDRR